MAHKFELPIEGEPWHGIPYPEPPPPIEASKSEWLAWRIRQPRMVCFNRRLPWYTRFNFWWQEKLGRLLRKWSDKLMGEPIEED